MRFALITGGSRGLGRALVEQLQRDGYAVVDFSRSAPYPFSVPADLAEPEDYCRRLATALAGTDANALTELLVINNAAAVDPLGPIALQSPNAIIANLNANFTSGILFIAMAVEKFQAVRCRKIIVNVSSGAALRGMAGGSLYCATKAGMENFIRALAAEQQREAAPFVAVNISPGVMDTQMQTQIRSASPTDIPDVQHFIGYQQRGELKLPSVVASAILKIVAHEGLRGGERYEVRDFGA